MQVTALCVRLVVNVLILLVAHIQQSYPQTSDAAARIIPSRLQLFEYESVSFTCEGFNVSTGWKVRNAKEFVKECSNDTAMSFVTCTLSYAYKSDSGEYWCEDEGGGEESNTVNITVTPGSVILESPVLPVMEGEAVTLSCRQKKNSSNLPADFFKDGRFIGSSSTGNMTIPSVSKSDEGLYNCCIAGAGESPGSWLVVRDSDLVLESPAHPVKEGDTVTLRCTGKKTSSNLEADFYKDGNFIGSGPLREMIIYRVSKSDEGLYKCRISGAGQSPDRQLSVKVHSNQVEESLPKHNGSVKQSEDSITEHTDRTDRRASKPAHFSRHYFLLLWILICVVLVLQVLVIGLLYRKKQLVLLEAKMFANKDLRDIVKKNKKDKKRDAADAADNLSLHLNTNHSTKPLTEEDQDEALPEPIPDYFSDQNEALPQPIPEYFSDQDEALPQPIPEYFSDQVETLAEPMPEYFSDQDATLAQPMPEYFSDQDETLAQPMPEYFSDQVETLAQPMPEHFSDQDEALPQPMPGSFNYAFTVDDALHVPPNVSPELEAPIYAEAEGFAVAADPDETYADIDTILGQESFY